MGASRHRPPWRYRVRRAQDPRRTVRQSLDELLPPLAWPSTLLAMRRVSVRLIRAPQGSATARSSPPLDLFEAEALHICDSATSSSTPIAHGGPYQVLR